MCVMLLAIEKTWDGAAAGLEERAELELTPGSACWTIDVRAAFHGDPAPASVAGSCPRLWTYEVVECFLVGHDQRYLEIELGPHGHYLLIELHGERNIVRQGMSAEYEASIDRQAHSWRARLALPAELVPAPIVALNAFALHGQQEARRHLSFHPLPGVRPNFHQPGRFPAVQFSDGR
jgi:hypothetical protein